VNGYLLDSNIALRATSQAASLSSNVRRAIERGPSYLSVVSYWEIVLKAMKGKLSVGDPRLWWQDTVDQLAATPLPLRADHVGGIVGLPPIHQDPFDRALIAQAQIDDLVLVTTDDAIAEYATKRFPVLLSSRGRTGR